MPDVVPLARLTEEPKKPLEWWEKPWLHVSATQIENFRNCNSFWYQATIIGPRPPQKPSQKLGDDIHIELQSYVDMDGIIRPSKYAKFVRAAAEHLPAPPFIHILAERQINFPAFVGGPRVVGKVDLTERQETTSLITDYKTSKNIRKYAKTELELSKNVQMVLYAHAEFLERPEAEIVGVGHLYLQTQGPLIAHPVGPVYLARGAVDIQITDILATVREMQALADARPRDFREVSQNFDHCNAFGGCPYREKCGTNKGAPDFSSWMTGEDTMTNTPQNPGRMASILAAKLARAKRQDEPAPAPAPEPTLEPVSDTQRVLRAKGFTDEDIKQLEAEDSIDEAVEGKITPSMMRYKPEAGVSASAPLAVELASAVCSRCNGKKYIPSRELLGDEGDRSGFLVCPICRGSGVAVGHVARRGQILPPDAPSRELKPGDVGIKGEVYNGPTRSVNVTIDNQPTPVAEVTVQVDDTSAVEEPKKRGRGRPPKSKIAETMAAKLATTPEPEGMTEGEAAAQAQAVARVSETAARVAALSTPEESRAKLVEASRPLAEALELGSVPISRLSSPESVRQETAVSVISTLYVDCLPFRGRDAGQTVDAEEWLYPIKAQVEKEKAMLDYRLKPFAEGKGLVVAAVRAAIQRDGLPPVLTVSSRSDLGQIFLEAVKPFKVNIVKGVF